MAKHQVCPKWFQFTHPGRGATSMNKTKMLEWIGFNSRTPGGVRLIGWLFVALWVQFQFTHPGRGATQGGH